MKARRPPAQLDGSPVEYTAHFGLGVLGVMINLVGEVAVRTIALARVRFG